MAKQTAGFMGGFHGRLGPAVGYMWRGVWCVRSYNPYPRNPRTEVQTQHREMFKREVQLASYMSWAVNLGFREISYDNGMTPYNMFVHLNQHAFSLVDGVFTVDYSALRLCSGPRAGVAFGTPVWEDDDVVTVRFDRDGSGLRSGSYDSVYLYAYCPDMVDGFLAAPVYRRQKRVSAAVPDCFAGHDVHLYGMVVSEDGEWSETMYVGCVNSAEYLGAPASRRQDGCSSATEGTDIRPRQPQSAATPSSLEGETEMAASNNDISQKERFKRRNLT